MTNSWHPDPWYERGACHGFPLSTFFSKHLEAQAVAVCERCPVRVECREDNDEWEARWTPTYWIGVFGGETARDRRRRRKRHREAEAPTTPDARTTDMGEVVELQTRTRGGAAPRSRQAFGESSAAAR